MKSVLKHGGDGLAPPFAETNGGKRNLDKQNGN